MRTLRLLPPVSLAPCVRRAIPTPRLVLCSLRLKTHFRRAWGLGVRRHPYRCLPTRETTDLPGSWGTRRDGSPGSWTPVGPTRLAMTACPPLVSTTRDLDQKTFEARCPGFPSRCLRFARWVAPQDARLASGCWPALPDGIRTRRVPTEGFRVVLVTSHPPSPGLAWRNDTFSLLGFFCSTKRIFSFQGGEKVSGTVLGRCA